jgi:hypothetical protein
MLFGMRNTRNQPQRRGGMFGGNLRGAALAGAGIMALRWWMNRRQAAPGHGNFEGQNVRNPVHGWQ